MWGDTAECTARATNGKRRRGGLRVINDVKGRPRTAERGRTS
jgi:hypothetical protein